MGATTLALFDLDHTLIPFDSGMAWTRFLVDRGVLASAAEAQYLEHCQQYVAGTLDIHAMHRSSFRPLRGYPRAEIARWQREFGLEMAPRVPGPALDLVGGHLRAGHLCAIVTATSCLVAEPFARLFGIDHLVATRSASVDGSAHTAFTGEIDGLPCFREHKLTHVENWLASRPGSATTLTGFSRSWFYSDSISDLPLLGAVSDPVAVRPDERLRAHALAAGWPVLDLA
ncbi:MAG: HAD-IB family hydrolase [Burkholderiaceae bacterium]